MNEGKTYTKNSVPTTCKVLTKCITKTSKLVLFEETVLTIGGMQRFCVSEYVVHRITTVF
jgi:hypothetical protein